MSSGDWGDALSPGGGRGGIWGVGGGIWGVGEEEFGVGEEEFRMGEEEIGVGAKSGEIIRKKVGEMVKNRENNGGFGV